jgi:oxygen-independent coproporphyrinogen-3 oxidase
MGYTVKLGGDMLGVGVSAIGDVQGCYAQNAKKLSTYYASIDRGELPIERGYELSRDDEIRREVITRLMCNFYLDVAALEQRYQIDFADYFSIELSELTAADGPEQHGFLEIATDSLKVVGNGRLFVRNVCMVFDRYLRAKDPQARVFSRTV